MTKPQHTPAPWKVLLPDEGLEKYQLRVHSILHGARSGVASVLHPQGDGTEDAFLETRANAALIAAAPYLLDALQFVMTATGEQLTTAFEQAQDAIDLALGEEDAWECSSCGGQGKYTRYHKVTHQLGSDELPFWDECETCGGLGSCGPDAERRASRKRARQ
jgi:hypothetical protein